MFYQFLPNCFEPTIPDLTNDENFNVYILSFDTRFDRFAKELADLLCMLTNLFQLK